MITRKMIEDWVYDEEYSLEEILEMFDIDKADVVISLYESGLMEPELLENLCTV